MDSNYIDYVFIPCIIFSMCMVSYLGGMDSQIPMSLLPHQIKLLAPHFNWEKPENIVILLDLFRPREY